MPGPQEYNQDSIQNTIHQKRELEINQTMLKSFERASGVPFVDPIDVKRRSYYRDVALSIDYSKIGQIRSLNQSPIGLGNNPVIPSKDFDTTQKIYKH